MAAAYLERMGERIRARRDELGLSRGEVARLMPGKTNENAIYRWEKGLHRPNPDALEALAGVLQVDIAYLIATPPDQDATPDLLAMSDGQQVARLERQIAQLGVALTEKIDEVEGRRQEIAETVEALLERQTKLLSKIETLVLALPSDETTQRLLQALDVSDLSPEPEQREAGGTGRAKRPRRRATG